jgi:putative tryptophan/tyrosine transport system substrate-binding protein
MQQSKSLKRRDFIALLGAAVAWPRALAAQPAERMRRIGVLMSNADGDPEGRARAAALRQGLAELGWKESANLRVDWRWSAGDVRLVRDYAAELVALAPDLLIANGASNLGALHEQTRSIPIVFVVVNDPLGQGVIASLARPGGNVTGFTFLEYSMVSKALEMLKQVAPAVSRVGIMFNPQTQPFYDRHFPTFEGDARKLAVDVVRAAVGSDAEIEAGVAKLGAQPGGGLLVPPDAYTLVHRGTIVKSAAAHRLPVAYSYRQGVREGGLISYGPDTVDIFRRSASYVDRILKGANPGELPAQAPTKFELAVNLKTAAALGLTIPANLLALADEVIE